MFLRAKKVNGKKYYQIVETRGKRQEVLAHLGTAENILKIWPLSHKKAALLGETSQVAKSDTMPGD
jgi:hypothetical protein